MSTNEIEKQTFEVVGAGHVQLKMGLSQCSGQKGISLEEDWSWKPNGQHRFIGGVLPTAHVKGMIRFLQRWLETYGER